MTGERSILYQLLSLFEGLYPGWVENLKKKPEKKKKVCAAYKSCLDPSITRDHLDLLLIYLNSSLNDQYRKWPPPPLELSRLFDLHKKKAQKSLLASASIAKAPTSAPDQKTISYLIGDAMVNRKRSSEVTEEIRPYLEAIEHSRTHRSYTDYLRFNLFYYHLRDHFQQLSAMKFIEGLLKPLNIEWILQHLGINGINFEQILTFLHQTRLNEEVYQYREALLKE